MRFLFIFMCMCYTTLSIAQNNTPSIKFVANWTKNDSFTFKVTKIFKKITDNKLMHNDSFSYTAVMKIVEMNNDNYRIHWRSNNPLSSLLTSLAIQPEYIKQVNHYKQPLVKYTTNRSGAFIRVENWKEISDSMTIMIDDLITTIQKQKNNVNNLKVAVLKQFKNTYKFEKGINTILFKELSLIHFPLGVEYKYKQPYKYNDELPNILGGEALKAEGSTIWDKTDSTKALYYFVHTLKLSNQNTKVFIEDLYRKMKMKEDDIQKSLKNSEFDIADYNDFVFDYKKGIPVKIESERKSVMNIKIYDDRRSDKIIIERIK